MSVAEVRLVSGEAVDLDIRLARAGSRVLALLIDVVVQIFLFYLLMIPMTLLLGLFAVYFPSAGIPLVQVGVIVLVAFMFVGYPTICLKLMRGRTPGKMVMGLRVLRADGGPLTWRQSFTRALVGTALEWPGVMLGFSWIISLGILVSSGRAQRLADLAAGTIVIHERSPASWGWVPSTPVPLQEWAATLDLANVDDRLALAARHFLARSRSFKEPHRTRLGEALAKELLSQTTPAPPPGTPGWAYLAAVVGERHRRAALRLTRHRSTQAKLWPELFVPLSAPTTATPAASPTYPGLRPASPVS